MTPDLPHRLAQALAGCVGPVGVAVSGGGDSVALLLGLAQSLPGRVRAVTFDHRLRAESALEAAWVARLCHRLGVPHTILHWPEAPRGNLMDAARRARIAAIAGWASGQEIADVALGHTADDQAETFLMNLSRAAGLEGLCGLRPQFACGGVTFHRPMLDVTRADLRAWLRAQGQDWLDDPSNENPRFLRARARKALAGLGIGAGTIAQSVAHLAAARGLVQAELLRLIDSHVREELGTLSITPGLPPEGLRLILSVAIRWMGGGDHPPRGTDLARLMARLAAGQTSTLAGCRFRPGAELRITREPRAVAGPSAPGGIWDHRWQVQGPFAPGQTLGALGETGLRLCPDWRAHGDRAALLVSPAVWHEGHLIAAPLARPHRDWQAATCPNFRMFAAAH